MRIETREAMEMLFCAKWNLPKAAKHCRLSRKEMMITFSEYCALHEPTHNKFETELQLELNYEQKGTENPT